MQLEGPYITNLGGYYLGRASSRAADVSQREIPNHPSPGLAIGRSSATQTLPEVSQRASMDGPRRSLAPDLRRDTKRFDCAGCINAWTNDVRPYIAQRDAQIAVHAGLDAQAGCVTFGYMR